jgi:hypothetical protein
VDALFWFAILKAAFPNVSSAIFWASPG